MKTTLGVFAVILLLQSSLVEARNSYKKIQQDTTVISSTNINGVHSYRATDGV